MLSIRFLANVDSASLAANQITCYNIYFIDCEFENFNEHSKDFEMAISSMKYDLKNVGIRTETLE